MFVIEHSLTYRIDTTGRTFICDGGKGWAFNRSGWRSAAAVVCELCYFRLSTAELEMGKNEKIRVRFRFGYFVDGIGTMFRWWAFVTD